MVHKFRKPQRWVLFLLHARTCKQSGVKCPIRNCVTVQKLLSHMSSCGDPQCLYPRCHHTEILIRHYENCTDRRCPVCVPVKIYHKQKASVRARAGLKLERRKLEKGLGSSDSVLESDGAGCGDCADVSDNLKLLEDMRTLVFSELQKQNPCPADDASKAKYLDVTRSLEEALYQMANTKEDYMNTTTLESHLASLKLNDYNQIQANANSASPGTLITNAPEVSAETTMEIEKVPENRDQLEIEMT